MYQAVRRYKHLWVFNGLYDITNRYLHFISFFEKNQLNYFRVTKGRLSFAKFFIDFKICWSQTDNKHISSFLWFDAGSTEQLLFFFFRKLLPSEHLSIKSWVCQNNFMSAVSV